MKVLNAYNTEALNRFNKRKILNTDVVEIPQDDPPEPSVPDSGLSDLPGSVLEIPENPILDFVNSQCHISEDLDQDLQAYQVPCSQDSTPSPERNINHHYTYHVVQASQAIYGSLVDRGVKGELESDVRILSISSRRYAVIGIDSHEFQGLDVIHVQPLLKLTVV